jgi:hypothetical protein
MCASIARAPAGIVGAVANQSPQCRLFYALVEGVRLAFSGSEGGGAGRLRTFLKPDWLGEQIVPSRLTKSIQPNSRVRASPRNYALWQLT